MEHRHISIATLCDVLGTTGQDLMGNVLAKRAMDRLVRAVERMSALIRSEAPERAVEDAQRRAGNIVAWYNIRGEEARQTLDAVHAAVLYGRMGQRWREIRRREEADWSARHSDARVPFREFHPTAYL